MYTFTTAYEEKWLLSDHLCIYQNLLIAHNMWPLQAFALRKKIVTVI